jgi:hypothetical protein
VLRAEFAVRRERRGVARRRRSGREMGGLVGVGVLEGRCRFVGAARAGVLLTFLSEMDIVFFRSFLEGHSWALVRWVGGFRDGKEGPSSGTSLPRFEWRVAQRIPLFNFSM